MSSAFSDHVMITARLIAMQRYARCLRFLLLLGSGIVVAACGTTWAPEPALLDETEPLEMSVRGGINPVSEAVEVVSPRPKDKPSVPPTINPGLATGDETDHNRKSVALTAKTLLGLSEREVAVLLGPAKETFVVPPSRILEYRFPDCDVTLYLYANLMTRDYAVLHMESNPHRTQSEAKPVCTARISHPPPAEEAM